jgi:RHS repeat-associated protein
LDRRTEFQYNGALRPVITIEKENGGVQAESRQIWCGLEACEERDNANSVRSRRFTGAATVSSTAYYVSRDHIGSIRDVTDTAGTRLSRHEYDPFGRMTTSGSTVISDAGFAGFRIHGPSGLLRAVYRNYDPGLGRWLSPDPIGLAGGDNLYVYVLNDPINFLDPNGLLGYKSGVPAATGDLLKMLNCIEMCAGVDLTITATTDSHPKKSPHGRGQAADIRYPKNPTDVLCCARRCGSEFALDEKKHPSPKSTGAHLHVQMPPGKNGGAGDLSGLPPVCDPPERKCSTR